MASVPKAGDEVKWKSPQGEVHGTVEGTVTSTAKVKGHVAKATKDKPQVKVKSDKTGAKAIHKPEELRKA